MKPSAFTYSPDAKARFLAALETLQNMDVSPNPLRFIGTSKDINRTVSNIQSANRNQRYWTLKYRSAGKPPSWTNKRAMGEWILANSLGVALYPGHYQLCVVDVDEGDSSILGKDFNPLHHSRSRSFHGYRESYKPGGHLFYPLPVSRWISTMDDSGKPIKNGQLEQLKIIRERKKTQPTFTWRGETYRVDFQHTQLVFVPPEEVVGLFDFLVRYFSEYGRYNTLPPNAAFPHEIFALHYGPDVDRYPRLQSHMARHVQQGPLDYDRWFHVAENIQYIQDRGVEKFDELFRWAESKHGRTDNTYPFDYSGALSLFPLLDHQFRFNIRDWQTEFRQDDIWRSMKTHDAAMDLVKSIRSQYTISQGESTTGPPKSWDPKRNWDVFLDWLNEFSRDEYRYDPLAEQLREWESAEPLDQGDSLILRMMSPAREDLGLIKRIHSIERNLLLTLYARIKTGHLTGRPASIEFPYLPTFVGPPGCGKTQFCKSLGVGYHTSSVRFDDPPKEYGEKAQTAVVIEMRELKEQLGTKLNSRIRGQAKGYIEDTQFEYRGAYERGSATTHHLMGVLIATSNYPLILDESDGLWRRIVHIPVQRSPGLLGDGSKKVFRKNWDDRWREIFPRAMARAAHHFNDGILPGLSEDLLITWLHHYIDQHLELVKGTWTDKSSLDDEFGL